MIKLEQTKQFDKLFNNTLVYLIGTFTSKGLLIILIPVITLNLTTEEYGYFDLILTLTMILAPIFTLQSIEAVFRFLFDAKEEERAGLLSNVWIIVFVGSFIFSTFMFILNFLYLKLTIFPLLVMYYVSYVVLLMYQRVSRSLGFNKQFAISGILNTVTLLVTQILALSFFDAKLVGLVTSYISSSILTSIYLEYKTKALRQFTFKQIDKKIISKIIKFGTPLIPNNISWWAVAAVNRFLIINYLGFSANGIFSITSRFTSILSMLIEVFKLSWQESAILSYKDADKGSLYSTVFNSYFNIVSTLCYILILVLKAVYPYLVSKDYYESWLYLPIVMVGVGISAFVSYYGAGYLAAERTSGAFWSTMIGALVNIVVSYYLIQKVGLFAPAIATVSAYLAIWSIRHNSMRSFYKIELDYKLLLSQFFLGAITFIIYYNNNIVLLYCYLIVLVIYALITNKLILFYIVKKIIELLKVKSNS